jgi:hypothetical protein
VLMKVSQMTDKIVDPDDYQWAQIPSNKGISKYDYLMDGKARELLIRDHGFTDVNNFRITLMAVARKRGLIARSKKLDNRRLVFQVIGERQANGHQ